MMWSLGEGWKGRVVYLCAILSPLVGGVLSFLPENHPQLGTPAHQPKTTMAPIRKGEYMIQTNSQSSARSVVRRVARLYF
jgi:hypothetical protein